MKKNVIILIVFIGVVVAWLYLDLGKEEPIVEEPIINEITDCGDDLNCFIEESKNCNLAKTNHTVTIKVFGVEYVAVSFLEIRGIESDKCIFYMRTEKIDSKFSDDLIQEMLAKGLTEQEIQQQEQEFSNSAKKQEGSTKSCSSDESDLIEEQEAQEQEQESSSLVEDQERPAKICRFDTNDLTEMLTRWERGSFFGDCKIMSENCTEVFNNGKI